MNKKEIENALHDYNWMINDIERERKKFKEYQGGNLVAQGGIESVMPKQQGSTSDPVALEIVRRSESSRRVKKLENKVMFIQERIPIITDEKERAILDCMLDGLSMSEISRHMRISRTNIYKIKDSIVEQFEHFGQKKQKMTWEKQCV